MQSDQCEQQNALNVLDSVIVETATHINDFTKSPNDFTRNLEYLYSSYE